MLVGELLMVPGGAFAVDLFPAIVVRRAALTLPAVRRPDLEAVVLTDSAAAPLVDGLAQVIGCQYGNACKNQHGPLGLPLLFAVAAPVAMLGWHVRG